MTRQGTKKCEFDFCNRRVNPIFIKDGDVHCGTHRSLISSVEQLIEVANDMLEREGLTLKATIEQKND